MAHLIRGFSDFLTFSRNAGYRQARRHHSHGRQLHLFVSPTLPMTKRSHGLLGLLSLIAGVILHLPGQVSGQSPLANGIQPLVPLERHSVHHLIPMNTRPLLLPQEQELFLKELEGQPPDWQTLRGLDLPEQSERLFQLNRERDEARLRHQRLLQHRVAFVWAGLLRRYLPEHGGFLVALGPEHTSTSWGMIRFKPMGLPDDLIAIPSPELMKQLLIQQQNGEQIEIGVLFLGTLIADESLIYTFSHDQKENGMILPVVQIAEVKYFINSPKPSSH